MFSVPPLHILSGEVAWLAGVRGPGVVAIRIAGWILAAVALYFRKEDALPKRQGSAIVWLRVVHGAVALCLLCGFLLAHLINHDMALWSVKLHGQVMEWLRHWYRSEWVEPALLVLLGVMIATGVPLVSSHSRQRADSFRILQMATGVYLGLFICAHVFAVLAARQGGIETDWYFGVGPHGLLVGRGALIAYYIYSAFFLFLHAGFGGLRGCGAGLHHYDSTDRGWIRRAPQRLVTPVVQTSRDDRQSRRTVCQGFPYTNATRSE